MQLIPLGASGCEGTTAVSCFRSKSPHAPQLVAPRALYSPAAHSKQAAAVPRSLYEPELQGMHTPRVASGEENEPAAQRLQLVRPGASAPHPAAQKEHAACAVRGWNFPGSHARQRRGLEAASR